jgi:hypothetical protein
MFISAVSSCVQKKSFFVNILPLSDALGSVGLEISVILEQQGSTLDVKVLPFSLGPIWQSAGVLFFLDVIWPGFLRPGFECQGLVTLGG